MRKLDADAVLSLRLSADDAQRLRREARVRGMTVSRLAREAIMRGLGSAPGVSMTFAVSTGAPLTVIMSAPYWCGTQTFNGPATVRLA